MKKKILFQDTSFRDGFQSVYGARVLTDDFIPAVEAASNAGITHFEAGGGARFQSLFLYCGESAFDMMDRFREAAGPEAKLQTLARGINVVALSAQPRDMIELHAKLFKKHGMTHIRNFDALNDMRNLDYSGKCIAEAGLHHQAVVTLMELPPGCSGAHDAEFYIRTLRDLLDREIPFQSICFKDASGTCNPKKIFDTIQGARKLLGQDVELWHHTHGTSGLSVTQYKASIEAGVDGICVARCPVSGGKSQPDLISVWHTLKGTEYTLDIDVRKLLEANAVFKECMRDYFVPPEALCVSPEVVFSPMPGGALTANTMMMRDTGTLSLYPQVIEDMAECIKLGGFGSSVTPVSQFYFQQAYANVTQGPWKRITEGYGKMILGYFGRTPSPPDEEIVKIAKEQLGLPVFDGDPLDLQEPGIPQATKTLEKEALPISDENIFIVGALATAGANKGLDFLKGKSSIKVRKNTKGEEGETHKNDGQCDIGSTTPASAESYRITVNGNDYDVRVEPKTGAIVSRDTSTTKPKEMGSERTEVKAKLPGSVLKILVTKGQRVRKDSPLVILEAMKMETKVCAPTEGTVISLKVTRGQTVKAGDILMILA